MGKFKNPQTITSTHPDQEDFGYSVAIHNGYVVVGDPHKGPGSPAILNNGEVHVYRLERGEFRHLQSIPNPSPTSDFFGQSVAIHSGYIVVGAHQDGHNDQTVYRLGSVYIYRLERGEFRHHQKIKPPDPEEGSGNDKFGWSFAIHDGYIVVGACADDGFTGSFYVYRLDGGEFRQHQHIKNPDGSMDDDYFGFMVAIHDGYIVVGASGDNSSSGSVYVYRLERGEFKHHQRIQNPDKGSPDNDQFGYSVAIHDGYIVVGANRDNGFSGSVYIYRLERGEFRHLQSIPNPDSASPDGDNFGWSVAIHDGYIVVGAHFDNNPANNAGSVYVYRLDRGKFRHHQKLESSDKKAKGEFGYSVAIHNGRVVVGQPYDQNAGDSSEQGSAYIYSYGY